MVKVADFLRVGDDTALSDHMPHFVWVLRDFALKLVDREGNTCTKSEYLETALANTKEDRCNVRRAIRQSFEKRDLHVMCQPGDTTRQFRTCKQFGKCLSELRSFIEPNAAPVRVDGAAKTLSLLTSHDSRASNDFSFAHTLHASRSAASQLGCHPPPLTQRADATGPLAALPKDALELVLRFYIRDRAAVLMGKKSFST